jgi:putative protease
MKQVVLLSSAGSINSMRYAFAYGTDAVYSEQPRYSLRVRNNEFNQLEKISEAISIARSMGKRFFIARNIALHNDKVPSYLRAMEPVIAMRAAVNWASVMFWERQGLRKAFIVATLQRTSRITKTAFPVHRAINLLAKYFSAQVMTFS